MDRPQCRHPSQPHRAKNRNQNAETAGGRRPQSKKQQKVSLFLSSSTQPWRKGGRREKPKASLPLGFLASHAPGGAGAEQREGGFKCLSQGTVAQLRSQAVSPAAARGPERELLTCGSHNRGCFSSSCSRRRRRRRKKSRC